VALDSALEHLLAVLGQRKVPSIHHLQPGLTTEEIDSLAEGLPFQFPDDLRSLYRWRNGSEPANRPNQLFPGGGFLPLNDAVVNYRGFLEAARGAVSGTSTNLSEIYDPRWFPVFLNYANSAYVVVCGGGPARGSVWDVLLEDVSERDQVADTIGHFIEIVARRWDVGAYFFDSQSGPLEDYAALAAERRAKHPMSIDVEILVNSLAADNPHECASALRSLKNFLYPEAGPLLLRLLEHSDRGARANAAALLGQMGDPSAIPALISAMDDREYSVRESAKWAISELQRPQTRREWS
jgi:cell wall assembly regulator SMI1